ncbi:zinc finger CCCH domain-containing protein 6, putative [Trypanosoma equiperdum]|uniref:Zinc finger CCCH domain-containing protein 6, putative n=1 Tax=Trypanosoma equiperdum TaxID=5694 RepID=A0A1G4I375_TRYEQ|nr:zinc finger CCCH domain-containing protein 6, putative [Trypanosoma equiperdum]
MAERRQPRVLGAQRTVSEVLGPKPVDISDIRLLIDRCVGGAVDSTPTLGELERVLSYFARHNSGYIRAGVDDLHILASEILNNNTRAVMVFGEFGSSFGDVEMYLISVVVQYNMSLEAITINAVNVSDDAVSMLCEALTKSRVSFIDFSSTPLESEAGHSLAALAHVNPYVRTIILDDTLVAEEVLDEIDVACQFNQSNFEANGGVVDPGGTAEVARIRHRIRNIIRAKHKKIIYCVPHVLGTCPDGDMCMFSHTPMTSGAPDTNANLHERIVDVFAVGGGLNKLPAPPKAGASWKNPEELGEHTLRLNLEKCRPGKASRKEVSDDGGMLRKSLMITVIPVALVAASVCALRLWKR